MRRRADAASPPDGASLDEGLAFLQRRGASWDEVYGWWEANEDFEMPDPRRADREAP